MIQDTDKVSPKSRRVYSFFTVFGLSEQIVRNSVTFAGRARIQGTMGIYDFNDYREFLKDQLAQRISDNPRYSLRAMAKNFEMAPSTLSEVLSGKNGLSLTTARRLAEKMKLKGKASAYFYELVALGAEKDPAVKSVIHERMRRLHPKKRETTDLSIELFKQMSDWYHAAILELPALKKFDFTADNIARTLKISKPQAELAISRLLNLGLLETLKNGQIVRRQNEYRVQSEVRSQAMRQYYRQMLAKISDSLETQTPKERLSGYLNLPIDAQALPEVDQAIDRFFSEIKDIAAKNKKPDNVYHLSLHFINMTKKESDL